MKDSKYPAHEMLIRWKEVGDLRWYETSDVDEFELVTEFNALQAELAAFRDAVVVLPWDEEPKTGDVVRLMSGDIAMCESFKHSEGETVLTAGYEGIDGFRHIRQFRIQECASVLNRSGKPALYETDLIKPTEGA